MADDLAVQTADDAYKYKLVDSVIYMDQFLGILQSKLGLSEKAAVPSITLDKYMNTPSKEKSGSAKDKIAVIFAQGNVIDGEGDDRSIGGDRFAKAIRKAREDKSVKAIVLRVNSPGGSALASDVILREVVLANEEKPVVASFGDLAASGGYYIACGARKIIAEPTTLTGSIGVWAAIPNMQGLLTNKLGITFDHAMTNKNADFISVNRPLSAYQTAVLQKEIDHIYDVFVGHVSNGRKISKEAVDSIGAGPHMERDGRQSAGPGGRSRRTDRSHRKCRRTGRHQGLPRDSAAGTEGRHHPDLGRPFRLKDPVDP
ncbi:MAG: S49 family peptidase [Marinilabiliales bacterium]|nr:S49 family peptidase [Marinilabiliales bacterium]